MITCQESSTPTMMAISWNEQGLPVFLNNIGPIQELLKISLFKFKFPAKASVQMLLNCDGLSSSSKNTISSTSVQFWKAISSVSVTDGETSIHCQLLCSSTLSNLSQFMLCIVTIVFSLLVEGSLFPLQIMHSNVGDIVLLQHQKIRFLPLFHYFVQTCTSSQ